MLSAVKQATRVILLGSLVLGAGCSHTQKAPAEAKADTTRFVVVLLDKTASVKDQNSVFVTATNRVIKDLKPGDRFALAEITGASASDFEFVVDKTLDKNPVYDPLTTNASEYKDTVADLKTARAKEREDLVGEVQKELKRKPKFLQTDLFGAINTAGAALSSWPGRKTLVILSDMIEEDNHIRFNHVHWTPAVQAKTLARVKKLGLIPTLKNTEIYVVGVRGPSLSVTQEIHAFWSEYFKEAGSPLLPSHYAHTLLDWAD